MSRHNLYHDCMEQGKKTLNSKDLIELTEHLRYYLYLLQRTRSSAIAFDDFDEILTVYNKYYIPDKYKKPYFVLEEKESVSRLLYLIWPRCGHSEKRIIELWKRYEIIRFVINKPGYDGLTQKVVRPLLQHIENKFSFCSKFLSDEYIRVLLANNSLAFKSLFSLETTTPDKKDDTVIFDISKPDFASMQALNLLHDLGHILHIHLTRDLKEMPENYRAMEYIMLRLGFGYRDTPDCEVFANCFALVAVLGTALEDASELSVMKKDDKDLLEQYFRMLLDPSNESDFFWNTT